MPISIERFAFLATLAISALWLVCTVQQFKINALERTVGTLRAALNLADSDEVR